MKIQLVSNRNFNQININWKCSLDLNEIPIEIHCEFSLNFNEMSIQNNGKPSLNLDKILSWKGSHFYDNFIKYFYFYSFYLFIHYNLNK